MKLIEHELRFMCDAARKPMKSTRAITDARAGRRAIQRVLLQSIDLLDTMAPTDYMTIRTGLGRGSGQESPGFRTMLKLPQRGRVAGVRGVPRARRRDAARDLRAPARSSRAVPARAKGLVDYDQLLQTWRAAPPDARLPDHRHRHAVAQGQALRPARARHEDSGSSRRCGTSATRCSPTGPRRKKRKGKEPGYHG